MECGNDGPEIDPTDEVKEVIEQIKPQLEAKLGKSVTEVEAKRSRKQV